MNSEPVFAPSHSDAIASTNLQDSRPGCERNNGNDDPKQCLANDDSDSANRKCIEVIKKAMAADKLAELAVMDPKRAKRSAFSHSGFSFPCRSFVWMKFLRS
jgi:hypothetical protein